MKHSYMQKTYKNLEDSYKKKISEIQEESLKKEQETEKILSEVSQMKAFY